MACSRFPSSNLVAVAKLEWVDWFNNRRLLAPIGYRSPAEVEAQYYREAAMQAAA